MNQLLEMLVCVRTGEALRPLTDSELEQVNARLASSSGSRTGCSETSQLEAGLVAVQAGLVYPIADDLPLLLPEDAIEVRIEG